jgi:FKBP-type peptidyl-prolyl cis-trans isomerase
MKNIISFALGCLFITSGWQLQARTAKATAKADATKDVSATAKTAEVKITDLKTGLGTEAINGKEVVVHYTGKLSDGKKFDSSLDRKEPFKFILGAGQVISGWDKGVLGMKIGGKRKLVIPPAMGYGATGVPGVIPPNSTLHFEVELLEVKG